MFDVIALLIRTLLPFIKESILQGLTPKEWIKRNKTGCIWLGVVLILMFSIIHLSSLVFNQSAMIHELNVGRNKLELSVQTVTMERDQAVKDALAFKNLHEELKAQHADVLEEAAKLEESNERYESWLRNCGIDTRYSGNGFPACPVRRVVVRQRPQPAPVVIPTPPPEEHKPSFRERLRALFGGKKEEK